VAGALAFFDAKMRTEVRATKSFSTKRNFFAGCLRLSNTAFLIPFWPKIGYNVAQGEGVHLIEAGLLDMADHETKNIHAKLRELQEFETFSPFCRIFYDLVDKWIARADNEKRELAEVFMDFLDVELHRHRSIRKLSRSGSITFPGQ